MTWERYPVIPFEVKTVEEKEDRYEFEGYASIFNIPDRVKDIVHPGAFKRTMDHNDGKFPLCWMHNKELIVGGVKVHEDTKGWRVAPGFLVKGVQRAEEAYKLMKATVIDGMSFAYRAIGPTYKGGFRHLKELAVGEVTLGPRSMIAHPDARVTEVKTLEIINDHRRWISEQLESKIWEDEEGWKEIRYRVRNPDDFSRIRAWWIKPNSIRALGGPLKAGGGTKIQALRFQKSAGWNLSKAKEWVVEHKEDLKIYDMLSETNFTMAEILHEIKETFPNSK